MVRSIVLPTLALIGVVFASWTVVSSHRPVPVTPPVQEPALSTFRDFVAGAGLVEPSSEAISIGTPIGGIVTAVPAVVGAEVKADDLLFQLDDRSLRAQLAAQEAAIAVAKASALTAKAVLADAKDQLSRFEAVSDQRAVSLDDLQHRRNAVLVAAARCEEAAAAILQSESTAQVTRVEISRYSIRAPRASTVLQVKVRPGEFATTGVLETPLVTLGDTTVLHVRVDIDENDAWRVSSKAEAEAYVRGNRALHTRLHFVRFEPYVIPKRSLTGDSTERVDTRVLQVIYAIDHDSPNVYVGQQMEVFIAAPATSEGMKTAGISP
jgi:multidrug efflux pump subunit AcrA (membrane-fusion protein)